MPNRTVSIPTIGHILLLGKEWTFTCVAEYRNSALMDYLKATNVIGPDAPTMTPEPELCGQIIPPSEEVSRPAHWPNAGTVTYRQYQHPMPCRLLIGHEGACQRHAHYARGYMRYACTFPRGTRLRVDRIYIRKGKADYDSLTFWALDLRAGEKGKKAVRFWAKLADVNTMVVTDKLTPARPIKVTLPPIRAIILRD